MVVGLIVLFIVLILIDIKTVINSNQKLKTSILYFTLIGLGFTISLLLLIDKAPASPVKVIEKIVKSIV